jgi:hypothetical protein
MALRARTGVREYIVGLLVRVRSVAGVEYGRAG